jgi:hypothetical protein
MDTFEKQLNDLQDKAINVVRGIIKSKGEESKHNNEKCLKITASDYMYNLDGERYLTELHSNCLVDNSGYEYNFTAFDIEKLLSLIDYLIIEYKA